MSRKWKEFSGIALLKWAALFAVAFVLSLPVTAETGFAANNYTVTVASGYLALRNAKAYDSSNEIGELYTGDTVEVPIQAELLTGLFIRQSMVKQDM